MIPTTLRCTALALSLTVLFGCMGSRLTQANFEKIEEGMTVAEVERILGEPTEMESTTLPVLGSAAVYKYRAEDGSEATLVFYQDKLKVKSGSLKR